MNCKTTRELMSEYIDGRLDQERAAQFRAHLDQCPACRHELAVIEKTVLLVRSLKPVEAPSGMVQQVHARLEAAKKRRVSLRPIKIFRPVLALAAGLVLILGFSTYFFLKQGRHQSGFTVASVEHKQTELALEADKDEVVRPVTVKKVADTRSAEKDGRIWKGEGSEVPQAKAMGLLTKDGEKDKQDEIRRFSGGARGGAGGDKSSPVASAPPAVAGLLAQEGEASYRETQAFNAQPSVANGSIPTSGKIQGFLAKEGESPARDEALMARSAGGAEQDIVRKITVAKSAASRGSAARISEAQPIVNLAIATTNRSAVEQVLFAFDKKRSDQKGQQVDLRAAAEAMPELGMNAVSADDYDRVIAITVSASRWKELLLKLNSHGAVSVAGREMQTARTISGTTDADTIADSAAESKDILNVRVTITSP